MLLLLHDKKPATNFPIVHSTAITAEGFQFTSMTAQGVTINFSDHILGQVETIADPLGARLFDFWTAKQMFDDGTVVNGYDIDLKLKLTEFLAPGGGTLLNFDLNMVADQVNGSMTITPSIQMAAPLAPTTCFHYCSMEFKVQLPGNGVASKCFVLLPERVQAVYPFNDVTKVPTASERKHMHPGASSKGGPIASAPYQVPGLTVYDEPSGEISPTVGAGSQCLYLWDSETLEGVLIRTKDKTGRCKILGVQNVDGDLLVKVKFIPQDNSIGIDNDSDETPFDYGMEIRPMRGDWNHALRYEAERMEAENFPVFQRKAINDPTSDFSYKAKRMQCFSPTWSDNTLTFDFGKFIEQNKRIRDFFFGAAYSVGGVWYGTEPYGLNVSAPDHTPLLSNAAAKIKEAAEEQLSVIIYLLPESPDKFTLDLRDLPIKDDLVRTRAGYVDANQSTVDASDEPLYLEHVSLPGRIKYLAFSWTNAANSKAYVEYIVDQFAGLDVAGFYLDGYNFFAAPCNDDASLDPEDRGTGSKTWMPGYMGASDYFRSETDAQGAIVAHEWPSDIAAAHADILTWISVGPHGISSTQVFGPAAQFGDRIRHSTFHSFGKGANDDADMENLNIPGIVSKEEYLNAVYLYWFVGGHMMPVSAFWDQRDEYFIALPGEQEYTDWFEDALPHYEFLRRLWWKREHLVRRFHTSKRLFEMPSTSIIRAKIFESAKLSHSQNSHIYAQGWYDEFRDLLGFSCANWTLSAEDGGEIGATETWDDVLTTATFPEMGASVRTVQLLDMETGDLTALADYDGGGTYTIPSISMPPGRVVWMLMGDFVEGEPDREVSLESHIQVDRGLEARTQQEITMESE